MSARKPRDGAATPAGIVAACDHSASPPAFACCSATVPGQGAARMRSRDIRTGVSCSHQRRHQCGSALAAATRRDGGGGALARAPLLPSSTSMLRTPPARRVRLAMALLPRAQLHAARRPLSLPPPPCLRTAFVPLACGARPPRLRAAHSAALGRRVEGRRRLREGRTSNSLPSSPAKVSGSPPRPRHPKAFQHLQLQSPCVRVRARACMRAPDPRRLTARAFADRF